MKNPSRLFSALPFFIITLLYSCTTTPPEKLKPPERISGLYIGRNLFQHDSVVIEIRFFPADVQGSGTAHLRITWDEDSPGYSELGMFNYSPVTGQLTLQLSEDSSINGFTAVVIGDDLPEFSADGILFLPQPDSDPEMAAIGPLDITGTWMLSYRYEGELVEVTLEMDRTGVFTEITHYFGAENNLIDMGRFRLDDSTGLVTFFYASGPESGYTGFYDKKQELIYTRGGDFSR